MNLKITWKYLLALFALTIVSGELHEQVHINTGRIVCGGYGPRDFNVWQTAADCANPSLAFLATLAGPLWSYLLMWMGALLLVKAKSADYKAVGFSLVFAPLPFARVFTAFMGGGDEKTVLKMLLQNELSLGTIKVLAAIMVLAFCFPPVYIAYRAIKNRYRALYVIGFCVMPLIILGAYVLTFLNSLLSKGFLSAPFVLGTPLLIVVHFSLMAVVLAFCAKWLLQINQTAKLSNRSEFDAFQS